MRLQHAVQLKYVMTTLKPILIPKEQNSTTLMIPVFKTK